MQILVSNRYRVFITIHPDAAGDRPVAPSAKKSSGRLASRSKARVSPFAGSRSTISSPRRKYFKFFASYREFLWQSYCLAVSGFKYFCSGHNSLLIFLKHYTKHIMYTLICIYIKGDFVNFYGDTWAKMRFTLKGRNKV